MKIDKNVSKEWKMPTQLNSVKHYSWERFNTVKHILSDVQPYRNKQYDTEIIFYLSWGYALSLTVTQFTNGNWSISICVFHMSFGSCYISHYSSLGMNRVGIREFVADILSGAEIFHITMGVPQYVPVHEGDIPF